MMQYQFTLPYPPSSNHYWFQNGNRRFIGAKGKQFRQDVKMVVNHLNPLTGKMYIDIMATMPDRRKRDLDNLLKATLDALQHGGLFEDDKDIDDIRIRRSSRIDKDIANLHIIVGNV